MCVIVNADDFGMTPAITQAILAAFENGYISQTTAMMNMPNVGDAMKEAAGRGVINKIGLHINLTTGPALTREMRESRFCNCSGDFEKRIAEEKRMMLPYGRKEREVIKGEIRAQIERFLSFNPVLLHADGHHHIHMRLPVASIVFPLLKEYGFKTIRRTYSRGYQFAVKSAMYYVRDEIFMRHLIRSGLKTTSFFGSADDFSLVNEHSESAETEMYEIMVHPRYNDRGIIVDTRDYRRNLGCPLDIVHSKIMRRKVRLVDYSELIGNNFDAHTGA